MTDMDDLELMSAESGETAGPEGLLTRLAELEQENDAFREHLAQVVRTASANEEIWRHFMEIERVLFRTRDVNRLVEELLHEIKSRFTPTQVILFISHPELLDRYFPAISRESDAVEEAAWIVPMPLEEAVSLFGTPPQPFLIDAGNLAEVEAFLPTGIPEIGSAVLIPLSIHDLLYGGLMLGSRDAHRYHRKAATDLLEQLGVKIALCMENCLSYEKVKDFAVQDPVTGLLNIFQIHTILDKEFRKARRSQSPLSILLVEPRFFHNLGENSNLVNAVLEHIAGVLKNTLPADESYLGRYGSDQFLVVLPNVLREEAEEAVPYLGQVLRKSPFLIENTAILIQALVGIGTMDQQSRHPQSLIDVAYGELSRLKMSLGSRPSD